MAASDKRECGRFAEFLRELGPSNCAAFTRRTARDSQRRYAVRRYNRDR